MWSRLLFAGIRKDLKGCLRPAVPARKYRSCLVLVVVNFGNFGNCPPIGSEKASPMVLCRSGIVDWFAIIFQNVSVMIMISPILSIAPSLVTRLICNRISAGCNRFRNAKLPLVMRLVLNCSAEAACLSGEVRFCFQESRLDLNACVPNTNSLRSFEIQSSRQASS